MDRNCMKKEEVSCVAFMVVAVVIIVSLFCCCCRSVICQNRLIKQVVKYGMLNLGPNAAIVIWRRKK